METMITLCNQPSEALEKHGCDGDSVQVTSEESVLICEDISFPEGDLRTVYIGPSGVFAVRDKSQSDPLALYDAIRSRLGVPRVRLYDTCHGIYIPQDGDFKPITDESELTAKIIEWTTQGRVILARQRREYLSDKCYKLTAFTRGEYVDEQGILYLKRGKRFVQASDKDPNKVFWLTFFGSAVGAHRFYLGKHLTGLIYLFTCGLFGVGWCLDLVLLLTGSLSDGKHHIVKYPTKRLKMALTAPLGSVIAVLSLFLFLSGIRLIAYQLSDGVYDIANDPSTAALLNTLLSTTK